MALTRKAFLVRASAATAAFAAASVAGSGTAEAGAEPHLYLYAILALTLNAERQMVKLQGAVDPPGHWRPAELEMLNSIRRASAAITAGADQYLAGGR
jgi:hypothetical protein